jgi:hypothetical protein
MAARMAGILLLADRHQAIPLRDQSAIPERIGGAKTKYGDRGALRQGGAQSRQGFGADQRRVPEYDQDIVEVAFDRRARTQHGMRRAPAFGLGEDLNARQNPPRLGGHRVLFRADDHCGRSALQGLDGAQDMLQQRAAGDLVQHLRVPRAQAHPLPGGEDDDETGPCCHCGSFENSVPS